MLVVATGAWEMAAVVGVSNGGTVNQSILPSSSRKNCSAIDSGMPDVVDSGKVKVDGDTCGERYALDCCGG